MTSELTKAELMNLLSAELPKNTERMARINTELQERINQIDEISERVARGGVRSLQELDSLTKDLENHRARVYELKREGDLMMMDLKMDLDAIDKLLA